MGYLFQVLCGFFKVVVAGAWLWRSTMAVYGVVVVGGGAATTTNPGRTMLTELGIPVLGAWQFGTLVAVAGVVFFVGRISYIETPRLKLDGLVRHWDGGSGREQGYNIRAKIKNISFKDGLHLRSQLVNIRPPPCWANQSLNCPLNLLTQNRLRQRMTADDSAPRDQRFEIHSKEEEHIELFKLYPAAIKIEIFHEGGTETFYHSEFFLDFVVSGLGAPLTFSVWLSHTDAGFTFVVIKDALDELAIAQVDWGGT